MFCIVSRGHEYPSGNSLIIAIIAQKIIDSSVNTPNPNTSGRSAKCRPGRFSRLPNMTQGQDNLERKALVLYTTYIKIKRALPTLDTFVAEQTNKSKKDYHPFIVRGLIVPRISAAYNCSKLALALFEMNFLLYILTRYDGVRMVYQ